MIARLRQYHALVQQYGWGPCLFRLSYDLRRKHGLLKRRFPAWRWEDRPLSSWLRSGVPADPGAYRAFRQNSDVRFFFPLGKPPQPCDEWVAGAVGEAEALQAGRFHYFSCRDGELGFPEPDWLLNSFTSQRDSIDKHWCERGDFEPGRGDVKYIWEPSRFMWAYALARAYAADSKQEYAETFWRLFESWWAANPPMRGPNWMCGQETAIRGMACVFALTVFWNSLATTDTRVAAMAVMLAASAERIIGNIGFAVAQRSNHGVGEAAGLWTIGLLFPEFEGASKWRKVGQSVLENEARRNCFPDGSYVQHSMNYQRFILHDYLYCLRLAELNGVSFSKLTSRRLTQCYKFLYQLQDETTGRLPNYGPNDGALILPLNGCDYQDYRPVIGSMHYLFKRERLYEDGPWGEDLLWLFGPQAREAPLRAIERSGRDFREGGYFTLRGGQSWGMVRCHSYRNRPNQADMLHLDLWWQGINVLRDSGSFSYYDPVAGWNQYFVSTAAHNTIVVGGADQMIKGPGFRWYSLLQARFLGRRRYDQIELWEGEHYGYRRLNCRATHRRSICRVGDQCWLIIDDVLGTGKEEIDIYWHLPDCEHQHTDDGVVLQTSQGFCRLHLFSLAEDWEWSLLRGVDQGNVRAGWDSRHYGLREPALTIRARARTELPTRFITLVGLGVSTKVIKSKLSNVFQWRLGDESPMLALGLNPPQAGISPITTIERDGQKCGLRS